MKRPLAIFAVILLALAGVFAAAALSGEHTNTASACTPTHTISDNGSTLEVVGGDCVTATATATDSTTTVLGPTTTVTTTVPGTTTSPTTTTQPTTTTATPPPLSWPSNPYPTGTPWNPGQPIQANTPLDPNSANIVSYWQAHVTAGYKLTIGSYAVEVVQSHASDPCYNVTESDNGGNVGRFGCIHIPAGTTVSPDPEGHLDVLDYANGHEFSFYKAAFNGSNWTAQCVQALNFSELPAYHHDCATTAGISNAAGLITPEDFAAGVIKHPLTMYAPHLFEQSYGVGYVCPAGFIGSGSGGADPAAPKAGAWFRMDPTLDVNALAIPAWQKVIVKALQDYGAFVRDQSGTDTGFYGENTINRPGAPSYTSVGLPGNSNQVLSTAIPWNRMRVLQAPC